MNMIMNMIMKMIIGMNYDQLSPREKEWLDNEMEKLLQ